MCVGSFITKTLLYISLKKKQNIATRKIKIKPGVVQFRHNNPYHTKIVCKFLRWFPKQKARLNRKNYYKFKPFLLSFAHKKSLVATKRFEDYNNIKKKFTYHVLNNFWRSEYKLAANYKMINSKLDYSLILSRFLKNTIYFLKNKKWIILKLYRWNINKNLYSSFNCFQLRSLHQIKKHINWTGVAFTWLSIYAFFGSYFLDEFKKRYLDLIKKYVISVQLKVFRYNVYLIISDGFNQKLYSYFTLKKAFPWERRKARMRMKNIKEFCTMNLKKFLNNSRKTKYKFRYCVVIVKKVHYRSTVLVKIVKHLNLLLLAIKIGNVKAHNGLRLPKRRRK